MASQVLVEIPAHQPVGDLPLPIQLFRVIAADQRHALPVQSLQACHMRGGSIGQAAAVEIQEGVIQQAQLGEGLRVLQYPAQRQAGHCPIDERRLAPHCRIDQPGQQQGQQDKK